MNKLKIPHTDWAEQYGEGHKEYLFACPGCHYDHRIIVRWGKFSNQTGPQWSFNGSMESPTFNPSLLIREFDGDTVVRTCHLYITDGRIQFLSDCTHALSGQTVDMEEVK